MRKSESVRNCWIVGAIAGLVVLLFVSGIGPTHWLGGVFLGLITFGLMGGFLVWLDGPDQADFGGDQFDADASLIAAAQSRALGLQLLAAETGTSAEAEAFEAVAEAAFAPDLVDAAKPVTAGDAAQMPDNLQQISGIGAKTAELLAGLGITRFDQIAAWDSAQKKEIAAALGRAGARIDADDWIGQAKALIGGTDG